jgi:hypothetical protein
MRNFSARSYCTLKYASLVGLFALFWLAPMLKLCGGLRCSWWLASSTLLLAWVPLVLLAVVAVAFRLWRKLFRRVKNPALAKPREPQLV